ncbi:MAG: hypothetical protein GXO34_00975 [Deltaproteobacteria bacterium]|nr:hypothetical protein [Deltaproteobacteria bacterium]
MKGKWFAFGVCFLLLPVLLVAGCSSTKVTGVWKDPKLENAVFSNILVVNTLLDDISRKKSERAIVEQLRVDGVEAMPSYRVLPPGKLPNVERVAESVKNNQFDAVLITKIIDRKDVERVVAEGCRGRWDEDYQHNRERLLEIACRPTPVTRKTDIYALETDLYRVSDKALVLSIKTDTTVDMPTSKLARGFASMVVEELRRAGVLARK